jgi:hypothetical protein
MVAAAFVALVVPVAAADDGGDDVGDVDVAMAPKVVMRCEPDELDVNHAGVDEIAAVFDVPRFVADRIVARRPYLQVSDLSVVLVLSPSKLGAVVDSGSACVLPAEVPLPSTAATCTVDDPRVDLHTATPAEISDRLGLRSGDADAVVAAKPYASLDHLTRVKGLGFVSLLRLMVGGCLSTPALDLEGAAWVKVPAGSGGVVSSGDYRIEVPAGAILDPDGAWVSVEVLDDAIGPTADFTIHGSWSGEVELTLPRATDAIQGVTLPIVVHNPNDPDAIWGPNALVVADDTVTFSTDTLSPHRQSEVDEPSTPHTQWLTDCLLELNPNSITPAPIPRTEKAAPSELMQCAYDGFIADWAGVGQVEIAGCEDTSELVTDATLPAGAISCTRTDDGETATWTFENTTSEREVGLASGIILAIDTDVGSGLTFEHTSSGIEGGLRAFITNWEGNSDWFFPGTRVSVSVPEGESGLVTVNTHRGYTALAFAVGAAADLAPDPTLSCTLALSDGEFESAIGWRNAIVDCIKGGAIGKNPWLAAAYLSAAATDTFVQAELLENDSIAIAHFAAGGPGPTYGIEIEPGPCLRNENTGELTLFWLLRNTGNVDLYVQGIARAGDGTLNRRVETRVGGATTSGLWLTTLGRDWEYINPMNWAAYTTPTEGVPVLMDSVGHDCGTRFIS